MIERVVDLADSMAAHQLARPVPAWHWGPALLGFAWAQLQDHLGDQRYGEGLQGYARHHVAHPPAIDSSDTAAPGLVTLELQRQGLAPPGTEELTRRVVGYVRDAPRATGGVVNHLGDGPWAKLYPRSVWVDTLMMFGVFPARAGVQFGDATLIDAAAALPAEAASLLQHPCGLWTHSFWTPAWHSRRGRRFPATTFWARGNGWVVASLPMILDEIGEHPQAPGIIRVLEATSTALRARQSPQGGFTTVLNGRSRGRPETAATALVAAGWLHAVRSGWLPGHFEAPARRALAHVTASIVDAPPIMQGPIQRWARTTAAAPPDERYPGPWLRGVSGPTIPTPAVPRLAYTRFTPEVPNASYGVAAAILAAIAADKMG